MLLKNTPDQIKQIIKDTMEKSLKSYIGSSFSSQSMKDIADQLNNMAILNTPILMSKSTWRSFLGIADKIKYKCC